jgi:hypothetical protein
LSLFLKRSKKLRSIFFVIPVSLFSFLTHYALLKEVFCGKKEIKGMDKRYPIVDVNKKRKARKELEQTRDKMTLRKLLEMERIYTKKPSLEVIQGGKSKN